MQFLLRSEINQINNIMNKYRREQIKTALQLIEEAYSLLSDAKNEEEMAYENLPESFQSSERGETMQENVDNLDEVVTALEEAMESLENIE